MDELKKLFQAKRILAMILAAAMVVTSLPATAHATSATDSAPVEEEQANVESSVSETTQAAEPESTIAETETTVDVSNESSAEEQSEEVESTVAAEEKTEITTEPTSVEKEETTTEAEESSVVESSVNAETTPVYDIVFELDPVDDKIAIYDGNEQFTGIGDKIKINKNGAFYATYNNRADADKTDIKDISLTWKNSDDSAVAENKPIKAGAYKLTVKLGEVSQTADFEIQKAPVTVSDFKLKEVKPGTKKADVKIADLLKDKTVEVGIGGYTYTNTNAELNVELVNIKDAVSGAEAGEELLKTGDYAAELKIVLDQTKLNETVKNNLTNYDLSVLENITKDITIEGLIQPKVEITLSAEKYPKLDEDGNIVKDENGKPVPADPRNDGIYVTYSGKEVVTPVKDTDYTVKVQYQDGFDNNGEEVFKEVEGAELKEVWKSVNRNGNETILDAAPTNAGTYRLYLIYEGKAGQYEKYEDAYIQITIEPAPLYIAPSAKNKEAKYMEGMTAREALNQAQVGYTAWKTVKAENGSYMLSDPHITDANAGSFWGTSNNSSLTQAYELVFFVAEYDKQAQKVVGLLDMDDTLEKDKSYLIVFSGYKGVYTASGGTNYNDSVRIEVNVGTEENPDIRYYYLYGWTDVNKAKDCSDSNYFADTDSIWYTQNDIFTPIARTPVTIDVKGILGEKPEGSTYENPITKLYDGKALYGERSEYKKATATYGTDNKTAPGTLTYEWQEKVDPWDDEYDYDYEEFYDKDGNVIEVRFWQTVQLRNAPVNAGTYRLKITYEDSSKETYAADPAFVYYDIKKQPIRVVSEAKNTTAYIDQTVEQFKAVLDKENHKIEYVNDLTKPTEGTPITNWKYGEQYDVYPVVAQRANKDADWRRMSDWETFETLPEGAEYGFWFVPEVKDSEGDFDDNYINERIISNEDGTEKIVSLSPDVIITVKNATTELKVTVNPDVAHTKIYDGKALDVTGLITVKAGETAVNLSELEGAEFGWEWEHWSKKDEKYATELINGGKYYYYINFPGNDTYRPVKGYVQADGTIGEQYEDPFFAEITQKELTITPGIKDPVVAGTEPVNIVTRDKSTFNGYIDADKAVFTYDAATGFAAVDGWPGFAFNVYKNPEQIQTDVLKGDTTYTVKYDPVNSGYNISLKVPYRYNYKVVGAGESISFTTVRGNSRVYNASVYSNGIGYISSVSLNDVIDKMKHTVTPKAMIPYYMTKDKNKDGNYIAIRINAPDEYNFQWPETAVYENSIIEAGGEIYDKNSYSITAIFKVPEDKSNCEFDIRWEDGYVEHFVLDFKNAILQADLRQAVSPKSIAFNAPTKKMVVGAFQMLDVKLTKTQESDIIHLSYEVDKDKVLFVNNEGETTALSAGSATVTVTATKKTGTDKNGNAIYEPTTPLKKASVKITVTDVTKPKIKKVTPTDTNVAVDYANLTYNDGFRREFYVLEGTATESVFEEKIAAMKDGQWKAAGFAIAPVYGDGYYTDAKGTTREKNLSNLIPNKQYTVYVRNVSAMRTVATVDGVKYNVADSHTGAVKTFKTIRQQVSGLNLYFEDGKSKLMGEDWERNYTVELKEKNTAVTVRGLFKELVEDGNPSADATDYKEYSLPLKGQDAKTYTNPKLQYFVGEYHEDGPQEEYIGTYNGERFYKTSLATINNKGKITLKGVGYITVIAQDITTGRYASAGLEITATPDTIAAKNTKLQVGQYIDLTEMLIYKQGRTTLTGTFNRRVVVDDALRKQIEDSNCIELDGDGAIVATNPGTVTLNLKDAYVPNKSASVKVQVAALEPVKNLKTTSITDKYADLEFVHSGFATAFRITVTDGRNSIMSSAYVDKDDVNAVYNAKTKKYTYTYRVNGLTKKSKYNVTITAMYETSKGVLVPSKDAKKSFTTTLMPASYVSLPKYANGAAPGYVGVKLLTVSNTSDASRDTDMYVRVGFVSGNTYTLTVGGEALNPGARYAKTDTLTWTSTNKKVATIKPNAGTYTATLKAVRAGTTYIEVRSKITKALIARYQLYIDPVGTASKYYGENETLQSGTQNTSGRWRISDIETFPGNYRLISFTAQADGYYNFEAGYYYDDGDDYYFENEGYLWLFDKNIGTGWNTDRLYDMAIEFGTTPECWMNAGQTIWIAVGSDRDLSDGLETTVYVSLNDY